MAIIFNEFVELNLKMGWVSMTFWTWLAITIALIGGVVAANVGKKKTERKYVIAFIWFIVAVILLLIWWFTRSPF
ncbi:hypothetical protein [Paraliobacillus zengyii]|uniref:hypothetical protein n=2 Tax=Bacillaceae TaxID=186817 RepID=UPI000E3C45B4|nr:hypothetical protein [Paraliobacillus zengyii]